mgnify:CR=1 FL=1
MIRGLSCACATSWAWTVSSTAAAMRCAGVNSVASCLMGGSSTMETSTAPWLSRMVMTSPGCSSTTATWQTPAAANPGIAITVNGAALTSATPVTIPANTDCVIYVKANLGAYESTMVPLGLSTGGYLEINSGDTELGHDVTLGLDGTFTNYVGGRLGGSITTGVHLIRLIRASGAWTFAATGTASFSPATGGTVAGAFSFNTLLARDRKSVV